ncbi:bifunctional 4-hydroxy-2-oxoglutarate aldolase/2-dehydro-3-deoxy-phosphogluconate aldolase [Pseudalkalibacillus sp. R45]|uniref:bifunctional 4-hydroxy-2-oxoglutarate aldolase/2-dehydro-3-deoxy-phosphogluconate aldolase n=1 Tax=Pseudalkalibacillus sp. R45 TaxID=3457433 RepID=UPI003FCEC064
MHDLEGNLQAIKEHRVVMIYRGLQPAECLEVSRVLFDAGVRLFEVTSNSPGTIESIEMLQSEFGEEVLIGAGTVMTPQQVEEAANAGATYIISPNVNVEVIRRTKELGLISIPGAMTPTEIEVAYRNGGDIIKVFPINHLGAEFITQLKGPLDSIDFMPSGGICLEMVEDLFNAGACAIGIGVQLLGKDLVRFKRWDLLQKRASEFIAASTNRNKVLT